MFIQSVLYRTVRLSIKSSIQACWPKEMLTFSIVCVQLKDKIRVLVRICYLEFRTRGSASVCQKNALNLEESYEN
jgi:hypothetical protein